RQITTSKNNTLRDFVVIRNSLLRKTLFFFAARSKMKRELRLLLLVSAVAAEKLRNKQMSCAEVESLTAGQHISNCEVRRIRVLESAYVIQSGRWSERGATRGRRDRYPKKLDLSSRRQGGTLRRGSA